MNGNRGSHMPGEGHHIGGHMLKSRKSAILLVALAVIMGLSFVAPKTVAAQEAGQKSHSAGGSGQIVNDRFWNDADGNPMYMQGGGIFDFPDPATGRVSHFWYGVHFSQAETYRHDPTHALTGNDFISVDVYKSENLSDWRYQGVALDRAQADAFSGDFGGRRAGWVCRTGVAYIPELQTYAMLIQHEMPTDVAGRDFDKKVLIATAHSPAGPFKAQRRIDMRDYGLGTSNTGDQSVFQDEDGTGYLIYSYGRGRGSVWAARIGARNGRVDLLEPTKLYQGFGREGNALFKHAGRYYLAGSDLFGWDASRIHFQVADHLFGPYQPVNQTVIMDGSRADFGHITQTGFYYTLRGSRAETVIHCGDRWADFAGNGLGYNQWNPLSFDDVGTPRFNSMSQWRLDADTGLWSVGEANDYVLNGSFEADRISVGEHGYRDKDGQVIGDIAGWRRVNPDAVANVADAYGRVGDFDLRFAPGRSREASIVQDLNAPGHVPLHAGRYLLKLSYMNPKGMDRARIAIESGGRTSEIDLADSTGTGWRQASLPVELVGGQTRIAVEASGSSGQTLHVDDVSLTDAPDKGAESNGEINQGANVLPAVHAGGGAVSVRLGVESAVSSHALAAGGIAAGSIPIFAAGCVAAGVLLMAVAGRGRRLLALN